MCSFYVTDNSHEVSQLINDIQAKLDKIRVSPRLFSWVGEWGHYFRNAILLVEIIIGLCFSVFVDACPACPHAFRHLRSHTVDLLTNPWVDSDCHTLTPSLSSMKKSELSSSLLFKSS